MKIIFPNSKYINKIDHNIIEKGSKEELKEILDSQTEILNKKFWTKERTKEFFKCLLES